METINARAIPMRKTPSLFVTEEDRALLLSWLASAALSPSMAIRARIVLGSAGGESARVIARGLGASIETVYLWRRRFHERGIAGLRAQAMPGRRSRIESRRERAILRAGDPRARGRPQSIAAVARAAGVSRATVRRLWERHGVSAGGSLARATAAPAAPLGPARIAGIFIDLPFRALARVRPAATRAEAAATSAPAREGGRAAQRPAAQGVAAPVLLVTALEAFAGPATGVRVPEHWDERALAALLDELTGGTTRAALEILAGPRTAPAPARSAAGDRDRAGSVHGSRLIRARTQGEWLNRASRWLIGAPAEQEPVLREALGHLLDYFAAWNQDSGPFVWMPGLAPRVSARA